MAQIYDSTKPTSGVTSFGELYQVIKDKDEALRSNFSGSSFPSSPTPGQNCWRSDRGTNGLKYIFTGDTTVGESGWIEDTENATIGKEVVNSRGTKPTLDQRLDVAINEDGTLKANITAYQSEWILPSLTFTYVDSTHFSVNGSQLDIYVANRYLKINLSTTFAQSTVVGATYDSTNDITNVTTTDAILDATLVSVEHSIIKDAFAHASGDNTKTFNVADAINPTEAIPFGQFTGHVLPFATATVPSGFLECNGAAISRTIYSRLFIVLGTIYGAGDGSTTFNIPDLRGEFIRGFDNGAGVDVGRTIGSNQNDDFKSHTHGLEYGGQGAPAGGTAISLGYDSPGSGTVITIGLTGGTETRVKNIAMMHCIKY
ncbi:MAG: hypothetical protein GXP61_08015 [Epsilonproteobacteria bacterium]|nr:hypothetical protein [Campylobacterota bacterium]